MVILHSYVSHYQVWYQQGIVHFHSFPEIWVLSRHAHRSMASETGSFVDHHMRSHGNLSLEPCLEQFSCVEGLKASGNSPKNSDANTRYENTWQNKNEFSLLCLFSYGNVWDIVWYSYLSPKKNKSLFLGACSISLFSFKAFTLSMAWMPWWKWLLPSHLSPLGFQQRRGSLLVLTLKQFGREYLEGKELSKAICNTYNISHNI